MLTRHASKSKSNSSSNGSNNIDDHREDLSEFIFGIFSEKVDDIYDIIYDPVFKIIDYTVSGFNQSYVKHHCDLYEPIKDYVNHKINLAKKVFNLCEEEKLFIEILLKSMSSNNLEFYSIVYCFELREKVPKNNLLFHLYFKTVFDSIYDRVIDRNKFWLNCDENTFSYEKKESMDFITKLDLKLSLENTKDNCDYFLINLFEKSYSMACQDLIKCKSLLFH